MKLLLWALCIYAIIPNTWAYYLAVMHLKDRRDHLRGFAKFNTYGFILPVGLVMDAFLNGIVCLITMRVPKDKLLTGTLHRFLNTESGWRCAFAAALCSNLLDPFDPSGSHCR